VGPGSSVGGVVVPIDKLGFLAPYLSLASIIALSAFAITYRLLHRRKIEGESTSS
jgi:hypothetical protein